MNPPLVSIIVPVYNVELYIERCILSIIRQVYKNWECVIVNDCTPDQSVDILKQVIQSHGELEDRFKFICHVNNKGLSAARNSGILKAQGDYIYFLDSDDYISVDCIQGMVNAVIAFDADIVWGGMDRIYDSDNHKYLPIGTEQRAYDRNEILQMYSRQILYTEAMNKLIRRNYLMENGILFVDGMLHEDVSWTFHLLAFSFKGAFYDRPTYAYIQRDGSIMSKLTSKNYYAQIENLRLIDRMINDFGLYHDLAYLTYYQYMIDYSIWMLFYRKTTLKERYQLYRGLRNTHVEFYKVLHIIKKECNIFNYHFFVKNNNLAYVCFEFQNTIRRIQGRINQI